jgi:hypothetical protein
MATIKRKLAALLFLGAKVGNPYHDKFGRFGSSEEGGSHEKAQQAASATRSAVAASIKADKSGNAEDHKAAAELHKKAAVAHDAASHEGSMQNALFHDSAVDAHQHQAREHTWLAGAKMNENHDEKGRFASGSGGSDDPDKEQDETSRSGEGKRPAGSGGGQHDNPHQAADLSKAAEDASQKAGMIGKHGTPTSKTADLHRAAANAWDRAANAHKELGNIMDRTKGSGPSYGGYHPGDESGYSTSHHLEADAARGAAEHHRTMAAKFDDMAKRGVNW